MASPMLCVCGAEPLSPAWRPGDGRAEWAVAGPDSPAAGCSLFPGCPGFLGSAGFWGAEEPCWERPGQHGGAARGAKAEGGSDGGQR